jgi:hypothetical protein
MVSLGPSFLLFDKSLETTTLIFIFDDLRIRRSLSWEETHAFSREPFKRTCYARLRSLTWSAFPLVLRQRSNQQNLRTFIFQPISMD